jgi:hypothetical protein
MAMLQKDYKVPQPRCGKAGALLIVSIRLPEAQQDIAAGPVDGAVRHCTRGCRRTTIPEPW